jgi:protein DGCR14
MFPPDADVSPYDPKPTSSSAEQTEPKIVKHANTRLPEQDEQPTRTSSSAPSSPTRSRIDAAIAGTPYRPRSPGVNNYSFVPVVPSPTPSELGPAAVRALMTTGTLLGTPRILSQDDDADIPMPGTPFRIAGPSAREALSHRLSNQASRSLRDRAAIMSGTPRRPAAAAASGKRGDMGPPTATPRQAALTPAAQRLLDRTMGTAATRRAEAMSRTSGWEGTPARSKDVSRVRWTPTPSPVTRRGG